MSEQVKQTNEEKIFTPILKMMQAAVAKRVEVAKSEEAQRIQHKTQQAKRVENEIQC